MSSSSGWYALVEMSFVFGVVLILLFWQLFSVKREIRQDKERDKAAVQSKNTEDNGRSNSD